MDPKKYGSYILKTPRKMTPRDTETLTFRMDTGLLMTATAWRSRVL